MKARIINGNYYNQWCKQKNINPDTLWNVMEVSKYEILLDTPMFSHGYWTGKEHCEIIPDTPDFSEELERILEI